VDAVNWTASNAEIDKMIRKIAFVREFFPKRVDLAVDMHGRYDMTTGKRVAKEAEPFKLLFLEEPVPPENVDAMRDIRESTSTPICCGENLYLRHGFREVLEKRAADIIMPDIQKCGGLLESRKIADMAHTYYVPFAPHCVVSPIGTMASAHVCAAVPNFLVLEWHWIQRLPLWKSFVKEGEIIEKGWITVTDRPGLGVEMNEEGRAALRSRGRLVRAHRLRRANVRREAVAVLACALAWSAASPSRRPRPTWRPTRSCAPAATPTTPSSTCSRRRPSA
jgi:galactonate dehydratase